jgi:RND family efflux transporter MFP subunit
MMRRWIGASLLLLTGLAGAHAAEVSALVQTVPARKAEIGETVTAYGRVRPDPGSVAVITTASAGRVDALWVQNGQQVAKGERLLALATDPAATMEWQQAQAQFELAKQEMSRVKRQLPDHLATRADLARATEQLAAARAAVKAARARGGDQPRRVLKAESAGVVTGVKVSPGDRVPADAELLSLAPNNHLIVRMGVEPDQATRIAAGQTVTLSDAFGFGEAIKGAVTKVTASLNPATQRVDVIVNLPAGQAGLPRQGAWLRGRIQLPAKSLLVVPRSAVLRDDRGAYVFVADHGRAKRVRVTPGPVDGGRVGVTGKLAEGDAVVTRGNYELVDGMAVREAGE